MENITFEKIPQALSELLCKVDELNNQLQAIRANQPINEPPITASELRERLKISKPTEIEMRKRGKLPYILVNGTYRYNWNEVIKFLEH